MKYGNCFWKMHWRWIILSLVRYLWILGWLGLNEADVELQLKLKCNRPGIADTECTGSVHRRWYAMLKVANFESPEARSGKKSIACICFSTLTHHLLRCNNISQTIEIHQKHKQKSFCVFSLSTVSQLCQMHQILGWKYWQSPHLLLSKPWKSTWCFRMPSDTLFIPFVSLQMSSRDLVEKSNLIQDRWLFLRPPECNQIRIFAKRFLRKQRSLSWSMSFTINKIWVLQKLWKAKYVWLDNPPAAFVSRKPKTSRTWKLFD